MSIIGAAVPAKGNLRMDSDGRLWWGGQAGVAPPVEQAFRARVRARAGWRWPS